VNRANTDGPAFLYNMAYTPNVERPRIDEDRLMELATFVANELPVVSGRNYRRRSKSVSALYLKYHAEASTPLSKSYFVKYLDQFNIRRDTVTDGCIYCKTSDHQLSGEELV
jgi:hypothetical protein